MGVDIFRGNGTRPCGLYLHVPFCSSKCPYCAFYSRFTDNDALECYLTGLEREAALMSSRFTGQLSTLYIGGGTPSVLPLQAWKRIFSALSQFARQSEFEFTVEANPESLTDNMLKEWENGGVNRISLGVQSLDDRLLKKLGRPHDSHRARQTVDRVLAQGFRLSCDLMFGLPQGTLRDFALSVRGLLQQGVSHLSVYQLTLEPGSRWSKKNPSDLSDGYGPYRWAQWYLPRHGLTQYEIASFAVPGQESRHNGLYWSRGNVIPLGPSSWGYWEGCRTRGESSLNSWSQALTQGRLPLRGWEILRGAQSASEAVILATRRSQGIDLKEWTKRYGTPVRSELEKRLSRLPSDCFRRGGERLALTARGMRLGNSLWSELLDL